MNKVLVKLHRGAALQNRLKKLKRILFCKCISLVLQKKKKKKKKEKWEITLSLAWNYVPY